MQLGKADLYNSYLQSLKRSIQTRGLQVFWDLLVQGMIILFTGECRSSPLRSSPFLPCDVRTFPHTMFLSLGNAQKTDWPESQHLSLLKQLFFAVWLTDSISLIGEDEVDGSTVSKDEANQVN